VAPPPRTDPAGLGGVIDAPKPSLSLRAALRLPFDPLLMVAVIGLGLCSLVAVAASSPEELGSYYVARQAVYFVLGLILALGVSRVDYSRRRE